MDRLQDFEVLFRVDFSVWISLLSRDLSPLLFLRIIILEILSLVIFGISFTSKSSFVKVEFFFNPDKRDFAPFSVISLRSRDK